jgi:hypothetical protein
MPANEPVSILYQLNSICALPICQWMTLSGYPINWIVFVHCLYASWWLCQSTLSTEWYLCTVCMPPDDPVRVPYQLNSICLCCVRMPTDVPLPQVVEEAAWLHNCRVTCDWLVTSRCSTWNSDYGSWIANLSCFQKSVYNAGNSIFNSYCVVSQVL